MSETPVHFLNLEYWFRLLYELFFGGPIPTHDLEAFAAGLWQALANAAYALSFFFLAVIVYMTIRLYQVRRDEEERYASVEAVAAVEENENARWRHIEELMGKLTESDWRQAVIEADIMLDDILLKRGITGETVGERMKQLDRATYATLPGLWEAHKVRNQIAHEGSSYRLTEQAARRAIARYEAFFRELGEI